MKYRLALAGLLLTGTASAQQDPALTPASGTSLTTRDPAAPVPKPQDARGLVEKPGIEGVDVILFLPRVVAAVPRLILQVGFWPIQAGLRATDRHHVIEHTKDLLYNDARTAAVVPAASYRSDFGFSYGANAFHEDVLGHDEKLALKVRFGGLYSQVYQLSFEADQIGGSRWWSDSRVRFEQNPNLRFYGIGRPAEVIQIGALQSPYGSDTETRFSQQRFLGLLKGGIAFGHPGAMIKVGAAGIFNQRSFGENKGDGGNLSIEEIYQTDLIAGFNHGFTTFEALGVLTIDFRDHPGRPSTGVFLDTFAGGVPGGDYPYFHYGAELTGFIDLYRGSRTLILRAAVEGVNPDDQAPFTELPRLGGPHRLRGYRLDTFRDRVAALGTVEYHYPVHELVNGTLFADVGQVGRDFTQTFDDLSTWNAGFGGGLGIGDADDMALRVEVAWRAPGMAGIDGWEIFFSTDPLQAFVDRSKQL